MSEADELKALREEVAELRREVAELRATTPRVYIQGQPQAPSPALPGMWPVQPLPMPPYWYQPCFGPNTSDASGIWRHKADCAHMTSGNAQVACSCGGLG